MRFYILHFVHFFGYDGGNEVWNLDLMKTIQIYHNWSNPSEK